MQSITKRYGYSTDHYIPHLTEDLGLIDLASCLEAYNTCKRHVLWSSSKLTDSSIDSGDMFRWRHDSYTVCFGVTFLLPQKLPSSF